MFIRFNGPSDILLSISQLFCMHHAAHQPYLASDSMRSWLCDVYRWKRLKDRWQDERNAQRKANGGSVPPQEENKVLDSEHVRDGPQNEADAAVARNSPSDVKQNAPAHDAKPAEGGTFNAGMVQGADDAADAAVGFADAMIEQVPF